MKRSIEFLVHDWNSNGTNDVTVVIDGEPVETLQELTFGIDISKFSIEEHADDCFTATVPLKVLVANLAVSPVRTAAQSYRMLTDAVNGGAK